MSLTNNIDSDSRARSGMTLIELLVVISILGILAAILIPRMRIVNKDRNIREAARIVASVFATASQRAVNEGVGGVLIERNGNILDVGGIQYAGTVLYVTRRLPPYIGDSTGDEAENFSAAANTLEIPTPFEQGELGSVERNPVRINDYISFNYSTVRYRITAVAPGGSPGSPMTLTVQANAALPPLPDAAASVPFVVHRQPRRLESSRTELPEGYIIDMRVSGQSVVANTPYFSTPGSKGMIFNSRGGINSLFTEGDTTFVLPNQNQYVLIREYDPDEETTDDSLSNPSNLWVSVGVQTGASNVANITPIDPSAGGTLDVKIAASRVIATEAVSADQ